MTTEKQWPLIKGVPRIWPSTRAIITPKKRERAYRMQCHYCLALFSTRDKRRCYCSTACRKAMHNAVRRMAQLDNIECPICHRRFTPRRRHQRWCSSQCRKLAYYRRKHGLAIDPLKEANATNPLMRFPKGTQAQREQSRAQNLRDKRHDRDEEQERNSVKPYQGHIGILDPTKLLPSDLARRIRELLAYQTDSETDQ